jgi:hypothetical protein
VVRGRFDAAEAAVEECGSQGSQESCQLSLFDMADRLSRMEAAKAFYQVLGESACASMSQPVGSVGVGSTPTPTPCACLLTRMAIHQTTHDAVPAVPAAAAVARSHGFLATHQAEPYGDILLSRGTQLE